MPLAVEVLELFAEAQAAHRDRILGQLAVYHGARQRDRWSAERERKCWRKVLTSLHRIRCRPDPIPSLHCAHVCPQCRARFYTSQALHLHAHRTHGVP